MKQRKGYIWVLIAAWCGVIFFMSGNNGEESSAASMFVVNLLNVIIHHLGVQSGFSIPEPLVRKAAHFTEYLLLGGMLFYSFFNEVKRFRSFAYAFTAGVFYATTDELHQLFVPGRTSSIYDVFIDATGVLAGAIALYLIFNKKSRHYIDK